MIPRARSSVIGDDTVEKWLDLKKDSDGEPVQLSSLVALDVQVLGEFAGAKVGIEGRNFPDSDWSLLTDNFGIALEFTSGSTIKRSGSTALFVRPNVVGGDDTTLLNVGIVVRKVRK